MTKNLRGLAALSAVSCIGSVAAAETLRRWGSTPAERRRPLPGDDDVPRPNLAVTQAVTIAAPPGEVWPWVVQIGTGRGGWYTYAALERMLGANVPDVDRIVPELQQLAAGDTIPLGAGVAIPVASLRRERHLLLVGHDETIGDVSWVFALEPAGDEATRLISRYRLRLPTALRAALAYVGAPVMSRGMLLGIKARAEARTATGSPAAGA